MSTLGWLVAILLCLVTHSTNGLLAIIAVCLVEVGLTVGNIRQGVTDLGRMLNDDEPDIEDVIKHFDDAVKRMEADIVSDTVSETFAKPPAGPQTMQAAPPNWLEPGIKES